MVSCVRKWLARLGVVQEIEIDDFKDAVTENLQHDRTAALKELVEETEVIKSRSETISRRVDRRKEDLDSLLSNLKKITNQAEDASSILRRMIMDEEAEDRD